MRGHDWEVVPTIIPPPPSPSHLGEGRKEGKALPPRGEGVRDLLPLDGGGWWG